MPLIAFQGEHGAYSEEAIVEVYGADTPTLPCESFAQLFQAVDMGRADLAMVPIENSTAGAINQSYDLLLDYDVKIAHEVIFRVRHALIAVPGTALTDIGRVVSHPAALAQCEHFVADHHWEAVAAYDTAGAAKQLAESPRPDAAAIASETAARMYGLQVLLRDVQDWSNNLTRFFVVGRHEVARAARSKTSLVFSTRHTPGALHACLGEFASRSINLTKLESRPDRRRPWHYVFYLDFEGHWDDAPCRDALIGLLNQTSFLKVLGSYPAAPLTETPGAEQV
jgi:prephenate dehydratase